MICIAMAITPKQWKTLQTPDVNGKGPRTEVFDIQKCTLSKLLEFEIQWGVKTSKAKDKSQPGMNSLDIRVSTVMTKMKAMKKSKTEIKNIIQRLVGRRNRK